MKNDLTFEWASKVLKYDSSTGRLVWLKRNGMGSHVKMWNTRFSERDAGTINNGYLRVRINSKGYLAHRLAWLLHYGEWPTMILDHINRDKIDNRICNLREVTNSENQINTGKWSTNKSGFKGVSWLKSKNRWRVCGSEKGKEYYIGLFKCKIEAADAYNNFRMRHLKDGWQNHKRAGQ